MSAHSHDHPGPDLTNHGLTNHDHPEHGHEGRDPQEHGRQKHGRHEHGRHEHGHHEHGHHEHGHHHGIGGHQHAPASFGRAFAIGIALNLAYVLGEVFYGVAAHSLALLRMQDTTWETC